MIDFDARTVAMVERAAALAEELKDHDSPEVRAVLAAWATSMADIDDTNELADLLRSSPEWGWFNESMHQLYQAQVHVRMDDIEGARAKVNLAREIVSDEVGRCSYDIDNELLTVCSAIADFDDYFAWHSESANDGTRPSTVNGCMSACLPHSSSCGQKGVLQWEFDPSTGEVDGPTCGEAAVKYCLSRCAEASDYDLVAVTWFTRLEDWNDQSGSTSLAEDVREIDTDGVR